MPANVRTLEQQADSTMTSLGDLLSGLRHVRTPTQGTGQHHANPMDPPRRGCGTCEEGLMYAANVESKNVMGHPNPGKGHSTQGHYSLSTSSSLDDALCSLSSPAAASASASPAAGAAALCDGQPGGAERGSHRSLSLTRSR